MTTTPAQPQGTNSMTRTITTSLAALLLVSAGACTSELTGNPPDNGGGGGTSGGEDNTFDHDNTGINPWDLLDRLLREGPPRYTSRVHSCPKMRVKTIGNLLASRGVNMGAGGATSAAGLYNSGQNALGIPNYGARVRENLTLTTSSASRLFDIYAAAAPEIIANFESSPACAGAGPLFDGSNNCLPNAISCLIGVPATLGHVEACNVAVHSASTIEIGKGIAVASLMAAAHTCE